MIKHIVFWTLHDEALGHSASDNAALVKSRLESLAGQIPGLLHIEVGLDISDSESSADVALYSEFEDLAALQAYQTHPAHEAVADFVGDVRSRRMVVDYEA